MFQKPEKSQPPEKSVHTALFHILEHWKAAKSVGVVKKSALKIINAKSNAGQNCYIRSNHLELDGVKCF